MLLSAVAALLFTRTSFYGKHPKDMAPRRQSGWIAALALLVASAGLFGCRASTADEDAAPQAAGSNRIQPYSENPSYWQYGDEPVLLIGGSKEDNLFQISDVEGHLDRLASVGGNYIRNTMSSRDEGNVWPFYRRENGQYDLERPNEAYYQRFERLLRAAHDRDVIVQIELWDRFDYARAPWLDNPFRPANNANYTSEESGLENEYPEHPGSNNNPFFRSIPAQDDNRLLLAYQRAHIDRVLEISLRYPNVLYCMDNETSANPDWGAYWARYVNEKAEEADAEVYVTEMWDAWDLKDEEHRQTLDHPERYDFADVSQNNHNENEEHWDNLQWGHEYTADTPRPLNNVKIYGADTGDYGTTRDALERFWRSILGGAASVRFHRPTSGIGLGETAQAHVQSARQFVDRFDLVNARPAAEHRLLGDRSSDEAYLSYVPGRQYAVYFTDGGAVELDLREADGTYRLRWLDIGASAWASDSTVEGGRHVFLQAPEPGHWVAFVERE